MKEIDVRGLSCSVYIDKAMDEMDADLGRTWPCWQMRPTPGIHVKLAGEKRLQVGMRGKDFEIIIQGRPGKPFALYPGESAIIKALEE